MNQDEEKRKAWWDRLTHHLPTKALMGGLAIILILVWIVAFTQPDGKLHIIFFDVGQGDAIFIQSPTGQQVLVDGGPDPATLLARLGEQMPFWDRTLDAMILTHPDADHLNGLVSVLERYRVGLVFDTGYPSDTPTYTRWRELLDEKQIPVYDGAVEPMMLSGGVTLTFLHPRRTLVEGSEADSNNNSIVVNLAMGQFSALLPGDIEARVEQMLAQSGQPLASTVLKAPHHGSDTSSSPGFLEVVNPQLVVISVGADNPFGHPSPEVLERLSSRTVLRTDERGTIEIITDGRDFWVEAKH